MNVRAQLGLVKRNANAPLTSRKLTPTWQSYL